MEKYLKILMILVWTSNKYNRSSKVINTNLIICKSVIKLGRHTINDGQHLYRFMLGRRIYYALLERLGWLNYFCFEFLTVEDELPVHDGKHMKFSFVECRLNLIKIFFSFLQFQWLIEQKSTEKNHANTCSYSFFELIYHFSCEQTSNRM